MADLDKLTDELAGKAALATGMSVAKRALQDALLTDEQRQARDAEQARAKKSQRTKWIAYGVIGLLLLIGVVGLALTYWYWFLLAGIASLGVLYARSRLRKRREESGKPEEAEKAEAEGAPSTASPKVEKSPARREAARPAPVSEEEQPAPRAPRRPTPEEAEAEAEAVDAELAAMKARLRK